MTDRKPPRQPPPLPQRVPSLENFRPMSERADARPQPLGPTTARRTAPPMPRRPEPEYEPEGRSLLVRLLLWSVFGIVGLVGAAAVALTVWSPTGLVRDQLVMRVKAKTGRDLTIAGPTSLSFFPNLAISMADVSLSAPPGMSGEPTLKMQALEASVPLLPLLQKQVNVERLVLRRPVIDLHVDSKGRRSWEFAEGVPLERVRLAQATSGRGATGQMPKELQDFVKQANPDSREATVSRGPLSALEALSLEDVQIEGGTIHYADDRSGFSGEAQSVDARIRLAGLSSPLDAKGSFVWKSEPIAFDTRLTTPKLMSEERPARLSLKISGRPIEFDYEGTVLLGRAPEAEGTISAKSPSLKALMALVGVRPAEGAVLGNASISGRLKASEAAITLADGAVLFDQQSAKGTLTIEQRPGRPLIRGNLQIAELDLNRLSMPAGVGPSVPAMPAAAIRPAAAPRAAPAVKPAQSIEDLLRDTPSKPGPRVQGFTKRHGWSDEAIDLSGLRLVDADLKLDVGRLLYRDLKVGQTLIRLALKDRALTANFDDIQLYEGRGRGLLTVDGAAAVPGFGANFSLEGTQALALLKDAADFDWIAGRAKVNIALGGTGASERQIVASLNGRADLQFRDGAVVGYNVQQILANITQGKFSGLERNPAARTDFSEMAASVVFVNGVASNKDLRLISPSLRITGAGSANMPERTIDYLLRPKLGVAADGGLEVPVKLAGSWDRPTITPDLDAVLKNPTQAVDTIKQLGEQFKKSNPEAVNKAKDLLNQLLRK